MGDRVMNIEETIKHYEQHALEMRESIEYDRRQKYAVNLKPQIDGLMHVENALIALKEKQEREKPTLDASQVRAGCMVHDKVYANEIMCSNPPQQKWICRKCGAEGIDTIGEYADDEYERLKKERVE